MTEYVIYKLYKPYPEYWDGPYSTLKKARAVLASKYATKDFAIFKTVTTRVTTRVPRRRTSTKA